MSVLSFEVSVGLALLWAAHLLMFSVVFLFCWRISLVCLALEIVGSLGEAWFQCRYRYGNLGEFLSINISWNQEFSDVLKF